MLRAFSRGIRLLSLVLHASESNRAASTPSGHRTWANKMLHRFKRDLVDSLLRLVVIIGATTQAIDLLVRSRRQWSDFSLTEDFAVFNQAWWLLGHGVVDPFD